MKEMEYKTEKCKPIVLDEGDYRDYHYVILSLGIHPTAYVEKKREYSEEALCLIETHCGFTYGYKGSVADTAYWNENDHRRYLGWDYAHYGDYMGYNKLLPKELCIDEKEWMTKEILRQVHTAIDDFCNLEDAVKSIIEQEKKEIVKEFIAWYKEHLEHIREHEKELLDDDVKHYQHYVDYRKGTTEMLDRLLYHIDSKLEEFLEEKGNERD